MDNANRNDNWDFYLRSLSNSARDSNSANDPASDPSILQSVRLIIFLQFSVWFPRKMEKYFCGKKILFLGRTLHHFCTLMCVSLIYLFFLDWSGEEALRIVQNREFGGFGG